jgi:molybdate transport system regulatory protein
MKIKHKIWFEAHGLTIFGPGRDIVFKQIDECHSLNSAAKKLHISYRLAWGKIKVAEERLGIQLVEVNPGEKKMHLTEGARALLAIFDDLEKEITPILQNAEDKIVALKKNSQEKEALASKEITKKETSNRSQSASLNPEHGLLNSLKRHMPKARRKEENEINFLKSICYLFILPLIDIACKISEECEILMYF